MSNLFFFPGQADGLLTVLLAIEPVSPPERKVCFATLSLTEHDSKGNPTGTVTCPMTEAEVNQILDVITGITLKALEGEE